MKRDCLLAACAGTALLGLYGCASGMQATRFSNPNFDFGFVERVAVVPFENLSNDRAAGARATRLTITAFLASGTLDVVEPGEVQAAIVQITNRPPSQSIELSNEEIVSLGQALGVQALVMGSVTQSDNLRSGSVAIPVVTLDLRMVETETGAIVWAATHSEKGSSVSARFLGTGAEPIAETTRECIRNVLATLIQ